MTLVSCERWRPCSRRRSVARVVAPAVASCLACSAEATEPLPDSQSYADIDLDEIRIRLAAVPEFARPGATLVIYEANVIVLHVARADYRAFSNICTHAGCGISVFDRDLFRCGCHGSEFDINGANVAGPALLPLKRYSVALDAEARILRIDLRN